MSFGGTRPCWFLKSTSKTINFFVFQASDISCWLFIVYPRLQQLKHILNHCVKNVRIWSYSGSHFSRNFPHLDWKREILRISPYSVRMWENAGKMRTRVTPNTDTFYATNAFRGSQNCKNKHVEKLKVLHHIWLAITLTKIFFF